MVSGDGKVQTNKCLFIKPGPVCDLTVCQKSIYLAEQGGRSRPGLKNWVSGRLSPSALSQLGMRVLHHPTRSVTSAGHTGGKSNGVSCTPQAPSLWRNQACFGFTSRVNCTWTKRKHLGGCSWWRPLPLSTVYQKVFWLLRIIKLPWREEAFHRHTGRAKKNYQSMFACI